MKTTEILLTEQPKVYLHAWAITREYGGPEEGGWWYDVGEIICRIGIATEELAADLYLWLNEGLKTARPKRNRYSMANDGPDLALTFDEEPREPFPAEQPHYE